jgi:uncharacterized radical SAM superfamily Fe-S cluster-containing enzyme
VFSRELDVEVGCLMLPLRDYTFVGTTQSLCPNCLAVVPAKIIVRGRRVYFRKQCSRCGVREDFVCADVAQYDQLEYTVPAKLPRLHGIEPDKGCPLDCGLCTEHEQHTCIGLVELTTSCNLTCPMCFASSAPGGRHATVEECRAAIDRLVEIEGRPEVLQLSGGEPTIHPQFEQILEYAVSQPIDYVQINTNGIRFARDLALVESLARFQDRLEIFFQFDGLHDGVNQALRGEPLLETKLQALERLGQAGVHVTLAVTLQGGVNDDQLGPIVQFAAARPWITGINFQPATYSGRHVLPETLERRITFPEVIRGIEQQTDGMFAAADFMPLPCAHPNCHQLAYAYRFDNTLVPLSRFLQVRQHLDLLANGICFTRERAKALIQQYLSRVSCCGGQCATEQSDATHAFSTDSPAGSNVFVPSRMDDHGWNACESAPAADDLATRAADDFFGRVLRQEMGAQDVVRITITSFLDRYNFDVRRLMKCCTHHVLPSGHVIPFCAYNTLYREGHVPLPPLRVVAEIGR